jgi:carboxyl-terminal processing protease
LRYYTSHTLSYTLLAALISYCPAAAAEEDPSAAANSLETARLRVVVSELVAQMDGLDPSQIWPFAQQLSELSHNAAPIMAAELETANEVTKLALARALCVVGEPGLGGRVLLETARGGSIPEVRARAASAIGVTRELAGFEPVGRALAMILKAEPEPVVKCAIADAILRSSGDAAERVISFSPDGQVGDDKSPRQEAIETLREILAGEDGRVAREAALVLGENGLPDDARTMLVHMAAEPTVDGKRAQLILKGSRPQWVDVLDEIAGKIEEAYVDENKIDREKLISSAAKGMATSLDDFSDYLTEDDVQDMDEMITGSYQGIGAWVGLRDGYFTIVSPVYDGPAYRAGIRSQDRITDVDGHSTGDIGFEKTVKKLKGPKGTTVDVKVIRRGWSEPQLFSIVREEIHIRNCYSQMLPGNIGYIRLTRFGDKSGEEMRSATSELVDQGAKGLVLDLRDNGGGLLSAAVEVGDVFLGPERVIVYSQGRDDVSPMRRYFSTEKEDDNIGEHPMSILVNSGTASASEIVAGALQDWGRAKLVGEQTFGKGSVQSLIPLRSTSWRTKLRLTIAKYYLPSGRCIDKLGVEPDVKFKEDSISGWESEQITKLKLIEKIDKIVHTEFTQTPEAFEAIAENDGRDMGVYPGMGTMLRNLDARISRDAIRRLTRSSVRRRVADRRGMEFVTDLQDDHVLRRGVYEVLVQGMDLTDLPGICKEILEEFADEPEPAVDAQAAAD